MGLSSSCGYFPRYSPADSLYCALAPDRAGSFVYDPRTWYFALVTQGLDTQLIAGDTLRIVGVPDGTPVAFTLEARAHIAYGPVPRGFQMPWAMDFREGTPHEFPAGELLYDEILVSEAGADGAEGNVVSHLDMVRTAGLPFKVKWWVGGGSAAGHSISMRVFFRCLGLPAGASLVSCRGFNANPTPVRATTWGAVKLLYR